MILELLMGAAAVQMSPIEAERAFAKDAHEIGNWTAFRKWAAPDALLFIPQPVNAQEFLKDRKDPPVPYHWWPGKSFVSCDGTFAVNSGPTVRDWGKAVGFFTTVWRREGEGWRWIYDHGSDLEAMRGEGGDIKPVIASCAGGPGPAPVPEMDPDVKYGSGQSKDGTLRWNWSVSKEGAHSFRAWLWTGTEMKRVIDDQVPAPPK